MINLDILIGNNFINSLCEGLLLFSFLFSFYRIISNSKSGVNNYFLLIILMLCYSLLYSPEEGDSYATLNTFQSFQYGVDQEKLHLEPVYFFLMSLFSKSYIFWRFSVWGTALFLYVLLMKRFKCNANISLFVWSILGLHAFYYQRISLAMAMMFLGVVLYEEFRTENKNLKKFCFSIILFLASYFFHRSMPIYFMVSILVLLLPNKRIPVIISLLLIPILLSIAINFIPDFLSTGSDNFQSWGEAYLVTSKAQSTANLNGIIFEFIRWTPFTAMMIFCLYKYLNSPQSFSIYEKYFLLFSVILYSLYFLLQGRVAYAFAGKMRMQSMLAMNMFLVIYLKDRINLKSSKLYVIFSFLIYLAIQIYIIF